MSVNPDVIPRYEQPTPAELGQMFHEVTAAVAHETCAHRRACERLWRIFVGPLSMRPDSEMAATLDCAECRAYE